MSWRRKIPAALHRVFLTLLALCLTLTITIPEVRGQTAAPARPSCCTTTKASCCCGTGACCRTVPPSPPQRQDRTDPARGTSSLELLATAPIAVAPFAPTTTTEAPRATDEGFANSAFRRRLHATFANFRE